MSEKCDGFELPRRLGRGVGPQPDPVGTNVGDVAA